MNTPTLDWLAGSATLDAITKDHQASRTENRAGGRLCQHHRHARGQDGIWTNAGILEPLFFRFIVHVHFTSFMYRSSKQAKLQLHYLVRRYHKSRRDVVPPSLSKARKSIGCVRQALPSNRLHMDHPGQFCRRSTTDQPVKDAQVHFVYLYCTPSRGLFNDPASNSFNQVSVASKVVDYS
jgi:hypothetical protein